MKIKTSVNKRPIIKLGARRDDSLMIDNDIYFEFDSIIGGVRPLVGTQVHVTAKRDHSKAEAGMLGLHVYM